MLLAGLQRHAQGRPAAGVFRHADDAARHGAAELFAGGEIRRVGAAVAHGNAKALARTRHHIGAHFPRRLEQAQAQQVRRDHRDGGLPVQPGDNRCQIVHRARQSGILQHAAEQALPGQFRRVADDQLEAETFGPGAQHVDGLGKTAPVNEESVGAAVAADPFRQGHGFGHGGRLVEQRCVRQRHAGQIHAHVLEGEQAFEPALGNLGLVGRVGGVPAGVFQHVALNHRGQMGVVIAHADEGARRGVPPGDGFQPREGFAFRHRAGEAERGVVEDVGGDGSGGEFVE